MPREDIVELSLHPVGDDLGGLLSVEPPDLPPYQALELSFRVLQLGGEEAVRQGIQVPTPSGDEVGVVHHHLPGRLLPQIGKLPEHLVGGAEIEGVGGVGVLKALGIQ